MKRHLALIVVIAAACLRLAAADIPQQTPQNQQQQGPANHQTEGPAEATPAAKSDVKLEVEPRKFGDRAGWRVKLPGGRTLATPAWADGKIFLGGGFGSHEFYALDAESGSLVWLYHTGDDGPTAAVYGDGCIAFNTESCELEILTPRGRRLWKKWLGDPLMSMPAIDKKRVYMAYPESRGDRSHYVACFDLESGKPIWRQPLHGEIITAPVLADGRVYLSTLAGVMYCFDAETGKVFWSDKRNATSSPAVWKGRAFYSQRSEKVRTENGKEVREQNESVSDMRSAASGPKDGDRAITSTTSSAVYLDYARKASSSSERAKQAADATVGFGGSKGDAKIAQASANLGENSVYGVWAYQGSRPTIYGERLYTGMGDTLKCVNIGDGKIVWARTLRDPKNKEGVERTLVPPAIVNGKIFEVTSYGELVVLHAASGKTLWTANLGEPVAFQPVVAKGRVYVPTTRGSVICVETGDPKDDGWYMWGANAQHTGIR
ncbi:MAG: hypothetical protein FJX76_16770 [Armatimonadetes bacterium]|nr:hypothetical protein [Armatimonadota bacterium]